MEITTSFQRGGGTHSGNEELAKVRAPRVVAAITGLDLDLIKGVPAFLGPFQYPRLGALITGLEHTPLLADLSKLDLATSSLMYLLAHYATGRIQNCSVEVRAEDGPLPKATAFWVPPSAGDEELSHTAMNPPKLMKVILRLQSRGSVSAELLAGLDDLYRSVMACAVRLGWSAADLDDCAR